MLCGVVEGFYGKPYRARQRGILIRNLSLLDEAAFVYAPKNDPFHRLRWREDYPAGEWSQLADNIVDAAESGVEFIFGISPWQFNNGDCENLRRKAGRAVDAGASGIAVLFDDIPETADGSLAARQLELARKALDGSPFLTSASRPDTDASTTANTPLLRSARWRPDCPTRAAPLSANALGWTSKTSKNATLKHGVTPATS